MAFTDPIAAGNRLVRDALQSENFSTGVSGWSIFRNGSAEFDALSLRGSLNVPSITLGGVDLATVINARALGCVAWMRGYPTTSTTSQDAIMWTEVDVIAGRLYEVSLMNITPDIANVKQCEFQIRYVTGTSAWPTNSSPTLAITLRLSQFEMGFIRAYYAPTTNHRLRLRASIVSLDGNTVRSWAPGDGCVLAVNDLGIAQPTNGSATNVQPGKTLKEWFVAPSGGLTYWGNGQFASNVSPFELWQGNMADGRGNYRGWMIFSGAQAANIADFVGVPQADILTCELYMNYVYWRLGTLGYATVGYHNKSSLSTTEPSGGVPNKLNVQYNGTGGGWFDLRAGGFGSGSIMEAMNNGYFKGFMIGNSPNGAEYAGKLNFDTDIPVLHCKYYK